MNTTQNLLNNPKVIFLKYIIKHFSQKITFIYIHIAERSPSGGDKNSHNFQLIFQLLLLSLLLLEILRFPVVMTLLASILICTLGINYNIGSDYKLIPHEFKIVINISILYACFIKTFYSNLKAFIKLSNLKIFIF